MKNITEVLLKQNLVRLRRSPEFQKRLAANIIVGILILVSALNFLFISINLNRFFRAIPGANPVNIINQVVFVYFFIDYLLRLIFQKYRSVSIKPYLLLRIPRKKLVGIMLIKTSQSLLNAIPFLFFLPFVFTEMLLHYSILSVAAWFCTILFVCLLNSYTVNYTKIKFRVYPVKTFLANCLVFVLLILSMFVFPVSPADIAEPMNLTLGYPALCLVPLAAAFLMIALNRRFLLNNLFIEEIKDSGKIKKSRENELKENFSFVSRYGSIGQFILLELKMILRNKRPKPLLYMSFLMVFYGLIFYANPIRTEFLKIFIASFMTGIFTFSYGITVFGWESSYFGFIMTEKIGMHSYLRAKYYFMSTVTLVLYILTSFYVIFGVKIIFINTAIFLFNVGVTPFIILFIAAFNKMKYKLDEGMYSQQGRGAQQYLGSLIVLALQFGIYFLLKSALNENGAIGAMAAFGIAGILLHSQILALIEKFFYIKKYSMIEGFRQS